MEALAALSVACNVFQALDFTYNVVKGGLYLARPGVESLPGNATAAELATDLRGLLAKVQTSSCTSTIDPQLESLCKGCDKLAEDLMSVLDSLKVTKKRQLVAKLIREQFEKKRYTELESRLNSYRAEINLYITVTLSSRIDAQTAQQSDDFKALSTTTQTRFLSLLTELEKQTDKITGQINQQSDLIQAVQKDAELTTVSEAESTRRLLADEQEWTRLHIVSKLQDSLDQSSASNASNVANTAAEIKTANLAMQDIVTDTIKVNAQTVHDDINRLRGNLLLVSQQIAATESKLDSVILQMRLDRQGAEARKELQQQATMLTKIYLSLQALYQQLQEVLASVMDQARSILGSVKFEKYFIKQEGPGEVQPIRLDKPPAHDRSALSRTITAISKIPSPRVYLSDTGFHHIRLQVAMMKPIRSSRSPRPTGHHRSQSAPPVTGAYAQTDVRDEEINTDIVTLYHQYCYYPFLPPIHRLLSDQWKHREHRLPNPLEEYRKNIRRHKVVIGDEAAVIELARQGNDFVWFMALVCAACETCIGWHRGARVVRIAFSVVSDWVEAIKKMGLSHSEIQVTSKDVQAISDSMTQLCREQDDDQIPGYAGKFDQKTTLGGRLEEDLILWKKVADTSELSREVKHFVLSELQWEVPGLENENADLYASVNGDSGDGKRLFDAQMVFFLVYMLMVSRLDMVAVVDAVNATMASTKQAAFPVLKVPGTIQCGFSVPVDSMALVLARVFIQFGATGVRWSRDDVSKKESTLELVKQQIQASHVDRSKISHEIEDRNTVDVSDHIVESVQQPRCTIPDRDQPSDDDMKDVPLE